MTEPRRMSSRGAVFIDWGRRTIEYPAGWSHQQVFEEVKDMYARGEISRLQLEDAIGWYMEKHREL